MLVALGWLLFVERPEYAEYAWRRPKEEWMT
jgi:hypothetical protein